MESIRQVTYNALMGILPRPAAMHQERHKEAYDKACEYMEHYHIHHKEGRPEAAKWCLDMARMWQEEQRMRWPNAMRCMGINPNV